MIDETYVKVKGVWMYLYRAVDSHGKTIECILNATRDAQAAKRILQRRLALVTLELLASFRSTKMRRISKPTKN